MEMTNISIDLSSVRFYINPPKDDKKSIYAEAVKRAYGDMSRHTLHFKDDSGYKGSTKEAMDRRQKLKDRITDLFIKEEYNVFNFTKQKEYDDWHKKMCQDVLDVFTTPDIEEIIPIAATKENETDPKIRKETFSMGQAQKIVNMVWKYVYTFYQYFNAINTDTNKFSDELKNFSSITDYLHSPIDYKVIEAVTNKNSGYYLECTAPIWAWSQLSYDEYFVFQKAIRTKLEDQGKHPFIWELENFPFN